MSKRLMMKTALATTLGVALSTAVVLPAQAQQTFKLTIASSHPVVLPWVGLMSTLFVPEVNKRVAALNNRMVDVTMVPVTAMP